MKRITSLVCALLLVPTLAAAEPQTPEEWYKEGETQYNLGNFTGAVEAFKKGFALETIESKKSAYLYNIAQSYRQAKDCSNAQFFYKRFLALKEADKTKPLSEKTRKDVEDRIKELEECARQQEAIRNRPPNDSMKPDGDTTPPDTAKPDGTKPDGTQVGAVDTGTGDGDDGEDGEDGEDGVTGRVETGPSMVSVRLAGGGAKVTMGDDSVPLLASVALIGGYPIPLNDKLRVEVGAGFTYKPVPYESMALANDGTANLIGTVANAGLVFAVAPKIAVRGDLGGALAMPHVRVGVSADYELTPNLVATVPLAFSYSPAKDGLREDITAITAFDFMVGLGYRM